MTIKKEKEDKKEYTLTDLPGIGPAVSAKLEAAGILDLMTLAVMTPSALGDSAGVSPAVARKAIQASRDMLDLGFVDSFRHLYPNEKEAYTWWTHWANARARNMGWRIDYCFISKDLVPKLNKAFIQPKTLGSDHCPVGVDIEL